MYLFLPEFSVLIWNATIIWPDLFVINIHIKIFFNQVCKLKKIQLNMNVFI